MRPSGTKERTEVKYVMIAMSVLVMLTSFYKTFTGVDVLSAFIGLIVCLIFYGVYKRNKLATICFFAFSVGAILMGLLAVYMMIRWMNRDNAEVRFSRPDLYIMGIAHAIFHSILTVIYLKRVRQEA